MAAAYILVRVFHYFSVIACMGKKHSIMTMIKCYLSQLYYINDCSSMTWRRNCFTIHTQLLYTITYVCMFVYVRAC